MLGRKKPAFTGGLAERELGGWLLLVAVLILLPGDPHNIPLIIILIQLVHPHLTRSLKIFGDGLKRSVFVKIPFINSHFF